MWWSFPAGRRARPEGTAPSRRARRIVAVGGGKGGIGKSLVSANLGIALARAGTSGHRSPTSTWVVRISTPAWGMTPTAGHALRRGHPGDPHRGPRRPDGHRQPPPGLRGDGCAGRRQPQGPRRAARGWWRSSSRWTPTTSSSTSALGTSLHTIDFFLLRRPRGAGPAAASPPRWRTPTVLEGGALPAAAAGRTGSGSRPAGRGGTAEPGQRAANAGRGRPAKCAGDAPRCSSAAGADHSRRSG